MNKDLIITALNEVPSRAILGSTLGISRQTIDKLIKRGTLDAGATLGEQLQLYCANLREQAAGRLANGEFDLATERAALAHQQRIRLELQNAVTQQEYGPIVELEMGLSSVLGMVASKLDTIVGKLKKQSDVLTADDLDVVSKVIADVRNDIAECTIDWFEDDNTEQDDEE